MKQRCNNFWIALRCGELSYLRRLCRAVSNDRCKFKCCSMKQTESLAETKKKERKTVPRKSFTSNVMKQMQNIRSCKKCKWSAQTRPFIDISPTTDCTSQFLNWVTRNTGELAVIVKCRCDLQKRERERERERKKKNEGKKRRRKERVPGAVQRVSQRVTRDIIKFPGEYYNREFIYTDN